MFLSQDIHTPLTDPAPRMGALSMAAACRIKRNSGFSHHILRWTHAKIRLTVYHLAAMLTGVPPSPALRSLSLPAPSFSQPSLGCPSETGLPRVQLNWSLSQCLVAWRTLQGPSYEGRNCVPAHLGTAHVLLVLVVIQAIISKWSFSCGIVYVPTVVYLEHGPFKGTGERKKVSPALKWKVLCVL